MTGREDGFTQVWVVPLTSEGLDASTGGVASGDTHRLSFSEDSFTAGLWVNDLFACDGKLRVGYSSMVTPRSVLEYGPASPSLALPHLGLASPWPCLARPPFVWPCLALFTPGASMDKTTHRSPMDHAPPTIRSNLRWG